MKSSDALRLLRHMADVAALRADPVLQRQHLIDGLSGLLGTNAGWLFAIDDFKPDRTMRYRAQVLTSQPDPAWLKYITEFGVRHPITDDPYAWAVLHDDRPRQVWRLTDVMPDGASKKRFAHVAKVADELQLSDGIVGVARIGPSRENVIGFSLHCLRGTPPLDQRRHDIGRLAVREIARLFQTGALHVAPPAMNELPPRLQQIQVRLMDGRSAKEIAAELCLSVHTVREHLKRLYAFYGVSSREELMAKFVR